MENSKDKGYIWLPYTTKTVRTEINDEIVWYSNKWKNFLLKIKHFFIKPKYLKKVHLCKNKVINPSSYGEVNITNDKNKIYKFKK